MQWRSTPRRATVTVGGEADLLERSTTMRDLTWADAAVHGAVLGQCSAHGPALGATFDAGTAILTWDEPRRRVAPGQAVVLYDGEEVVGGGLAATSWGAAPPRPPSPPDSLAVARSASARSPRSVTTSRLLGTEQS